jgi:hypothetical protein
MDTLNSLPPLSPRLKAQLEIDNFIIELPYGRDFGPEHPKPTGEEKSDFRKSKRQAIEALERLRERCEQLQPQIEARRVFTIRLLVVVSILVGGFFVAAAWAALRAGGWEIAAGLGAGGGAGVLGLLIWPFREEKRLFEEYVTTKTWPERALVLIAATSNESELREACTIIYNNLK